MYLGGNWVEGSCYLGVAGLAVVRPCVATGCCIVTVCQWAVSNCVVAIYIVSIEFLLPLSSSVLENSFYLNSEVLFCFQFSSSSHLMGDGGRGGE